MMRQVNEKDRYSTGGISAVYRTPKGFSDLVLTADGEVLTGLHFVDSRKAGRIRLDGADCGETASALRLGRGRPCRITVCNLPVFRETYRWLDEYFAGREPGFTPPYRIDGLTPFRSDVIDAMLKIPFGESATYGEIAAEIVRKRELTRMSAQAVGGAVGWNPICIIIPCHRVIGADGALVGYGGGIRNKIALLKLEAEAAQKDK